MKTSEELNLMTSAELAEHINSINQTPICKNTKYCKMVIDIFLKKTNPC